MSGINERGLNNTKRALATFFTIGYVLPLLGGFVFFLVYAATWAPAFFDSDDVSFDDAVKMLRVIMLVSFIFSHVLAVFCALPIAWRVYKTGVFTRAFGLLTVLAAQVPIGGVLLWYYRETPGEAVGMIAVAGIISVAAVLLGHLLLSRIGLMGAAHAE